MAVKYAVANGNWTAGATWNDGTIPTADDDVYANNHTVTINVATLVVGALNTIANADYGIMQGGLFTCNTPTNISASRTCDLRFSSGNVCVNYNANTNANCYFTAPLIKCNSNGMISHIYGDNTGWVITANVEISNTTTRLGYAGIGNNRHILTINGNITSMYGFVFSMFTPSTTAGWTIIINGNVYGGHESAENQGLGYVIINGNKHYCLNEYDNFEKGGLTINGSVIYEANNGKAGIDLNHTTILNPSTFTWKDVTEPRSNPFIILTDVEMNNRQQYPPENEVKEGTEYVWGQKIGTYQQPPESVVLKDFVYDTIIAEENDIATYNAVRYIYADYGTLHWFELKTTTTDIVTDTTSQSIDIDGDTVVADTDYVVEYNDVCYQWSGSAWGSITTKNIGMVKTDIVTNPTETTLCTKKGTLETTNISQQLISRLENCATIETVQQLLVAHLDN